MKHNKTRNSGFTLLETLLAVAILVILLGLSMVGVARYKDYLKITELDNAARDIYMAAENRAVLLQNSGRLGTPSAALLLSTGSETVDSKNVRILSNATVSGTLDGLLPVGSIDPALREKYFRVVYDEATGHVVEVFYGEKEIDSDLTLFRGKTRAERISVSRGGKSLVGYYGSEAAPPIGTKPLPTPGVEVLITNDSELTLTVRYTMPTNADGSPVAATRVPKVTLTYDGNEVTLLSEDGSSLYISRLTSNIPITAITNPASAEYTWVLDSLDTSKQFKDLVSDNLGDNFTVTASLKLSAPGYIESAYYAQASDNSLFAKGTNYSNTEKDGVAANTALIANLRHLQNLCAAHSAVGMGTANAEQLCNIDCEKAKRNDGTDITPSDERYSFIPIENDNLKLYDGQNFHIYNLSTIDAASAGLFGSVTDLKIDNCRVCWSKPEELIKDESFVYAVSGTNAGGLVGDASGNVTITNSFAATTVSGTSIAGGLVGKVTGGTTATVTITNSYADCYLKTGTGENDSAGGLVGLGAASLTNCYAAGFIVDPEPGNNKTAGLVFGTGTTTASNSYSVVRLLNTADGSLAKPAKPLYGDAGDGSGSVRYLYKEGVAASDFGGSGTVFQDTPETHVYDVRFELTGKNEDKLTGKTYFFPGLKDTNNIDMPHYGDWAELDQASAGLVYYEVYSGETAPGVNGPGLTDTLKPDTEYPVVTRDGYALVFEADAILDVQSGLKVTYGGAQEWTLKKEGATSSDTNAAVKDVDPWEWSIEASAPQEFDKNATYEITQGTGENEKTYILIPLPDAIVTGNLAGAGAFYQRLDISPAGSTDTENTNTYYFNPHFGRTVKEAEKDAGGNITAPGAVGTEAYPVSVRTARHLYGLSCFQHAGSLVYATQGYYFSQELNIDYSTYTVGYNSSFTGSIQYSGTAPYEQAPIGLSNNSFAGTYDGGSHTIRSVLYKTDPTYIGLFGHSLGTLQNIIYEANGQTAEKDGGIYMGSLAGYSATITNCRVDVAGNMTVQGVGTTYGGGLAGQAGAMKNCTVTVNGDLYITGTTNTYGGGLAAHSESTTSCTSTVEGNLTVKGTVDGNITYGGGLVGYISDNGEKTTDCYAETKGTLTVASEGTRANAYGGGLAGLAVRWGGTTKNCNAKVGTLVVSVQATADGTGLREAYGGGLVGRADVGSFENCRAEAGDITVTGNGRYVYAGGLVGLATNLTNCKTKTDILTIKGTESITSTHGGGLLGRIAGNVDGCQATIGTLSVEGAGNLTCGGGLAGDTGGNLTNCTSTSEIGSVTVKGTGSGDAYGGGLVGSAGGNVTGCSNIEVANVSVEGTGGGAIYGGGLVGSAYSLDSCSNITVANVTVNGTGSGDAYGGGLAGRTTGNVEKCDVKIGPLSVTGNGTLVYGGGLAGMADYVGICKVIKAESLTIEGQGTGGGAVTYGGGLAGYSNWGAGNCSVTVEKALTVTGAGEKTYGGGLVGIHQQKGGSATVNNSTVKAGTITVTGSGAETYGGGVVGRGIYRVENCEAEITSSLTVTGAGGKTYAGGVAGFVERSGDGDVRKSSVKAGTITVTGSGAETYGGGVVGRASFYVVDCTAEITDYMTVTGTGTGDTYGGGVAGYVYDNIREKCIANIGSLTVTGSGSKTCGGGVAGYAGYSDNCNATAESVTVTGTGTGDTYGGGLAGWSEWGANNGCYAELGSLSVTGAGNETCAGGLVGRHKTLDNSCSIFQSIATADTITVKGTGTNTYAGGLVGLTANDVNNCAAVIGSLSVTGNSYAGGLVGCVDDGNGIYGSITCSYAVGRITEGSWAGGLVGSTKRPVSNSYSAVAVNGTTKGDLCGDWSSGASFTNCYYLNGTWNYNGAACSALDTGNPSGVIGKSYDELKNIAGTLGTEWGTVTGTDVYPFPVSTKKDGNWYYPGTDWPKIPAVAAQAQPEPMALLLPDALPVEPILRSKDESEP